MSLARKGELALVRDIKRRFSSRLPRGGTGIGDDAAIMAPDGRSLLATVDSMVEGVHFDLSFMSPAQLGFKLVAVNVSDIYAMGGSPRYAFLSLALPASTKLSFVDSFFDGIEEGLKVHGTLLAGGDLSSSPSGISMSLTVLGYAEAPIRRSGARAGDAIFVTATLGDSACGLELLRRIGRRVDLQKGLKRPLPWQVMGPLIGRHLMPEVRPVTKAVMGTASAMMDLSDGLLLDLWRLCEASGVGAEIDEPLLPISKEMIEAASHLGLDPLRLALSGGEDYGILFTTPHAHKRFRGARRIGTIARSGYKLVDATGRKRNVVPEGYGHFSGA